MQCYIAQICHVRLKTSASRQITKDAYDEVTRWLGQWNPRTSFEAVVASSYTEAVKVLSEERLVPAWLQRYGVHRRHFEFEISGQEVKNGRFWMPSSLVICKHHDFSPEEPK